MSGIGGEEKDRLAGMTKSVMNGVGRRDCGFSDTALSNKEVQFRHEGILTNRTEREDAVPVGYLDVC